MIIFAVVILVLLGIAVYIAELTVCEMQGAGIISLILFFVAGLLAGYVETSNEPQAIDVYRGKTTLEITYKDNIPIDTVVVFKNE